MNTIVIIKNSAPGSMNNGSLGCRTSLHMISMKESEIGKHTGQSLENCTPNNNLSQLSAHRDILGARRSPGGASDRDPEIGTGR